MQNANIQNQFLADRKVKNVALLVISGDRDLCGTFNQKIVKMTEDRLDSL